MHRNVLWGFTETATLCLRKYLSIDSDTPWSYGITTSPLDFSLFLSLLVVLVFLFFIETLLCLLTILGSHILSVLDKKYCTLCIICKYKNSAEVEIAPAFGEITTACNVCQAKNGSWCLLEE